MANTHKVKIINRILKEIPEASVSIESVLWSHNLSQGRQLLHNWRIGVVSGVPPQCIAVVEHVDLNKCLEIILTKL